MQISKDNITASIFKMVGAGKKVPEQPGKSAKESMDILVDLWWSLFGDKNISIERWEQATDIAIVATDAGMVNLNYITPALMNYGLAQQMKEHLAEQQAKAAQHKDVTVNIKVTDHQTYANHYLWEWTASKAAMKKPIMADMPSHKAVMEFAEKYNIPCEVPVGKNTKGGFNYRLIQTYLSDSHCCKQKCDPVRCHLHKQRPKMIIQDGMVRFDFVKCGS